MRIGDTKTVTGRYGNWERQATAEMLVYRSDECCYWYAFEGSSTYNCCDSEPVEFCNAEVLADMYCFTHDPCTSEADLKDKVDS